MCSPTDVRSLTVGNVTMTDQGSVFSLARAKTGRPAAATLSRWSEAILDAYLDKLGVTLHDATPLFWTRGGIGARRAAGRGLPAPTPVIGSESISGISGRWYSVPTIAPNSGYAPVRSRRGHAGRCLPEQVVGEDGQYAQRLEPAAPDIYSGGYRLRPRRGRGPGSRAERIGAKSCNSGRSRSCNRSNRRKLTL